MFGSCDGAGGIVARARSCILSQCSNKGELTSRTCTGGIIARIMDGYNNIGLCCKYGSLRVTGNAENYPCGRFDWTVV